MRKFLFALVLGVGMLVPLAIPTAAEARPVRAYNRAYPAHYHRYDHYRAWHGTYYRHRR
jgi:hypothetical protein